MADSTTAYLSLPEPDKADHLWRYTPWRRIHPTGTIGEVPESCAPVLSLSTIDGDDAPEGIRIEMANETDIERLTVPSFGSGETAAAFIRALAAGSAAILTVEEGAHFDGPVLLQVEGRGETCALHLILDIGARAEIELATLITGDAEWMGLLREGEVGEGAQVSDVVIQFASGRLLRLDAISHRRDAQVRASTVNADGSRVKTDLRHRLVGRGAHVRLLGSILGSGDSDLDHHIEIEHEAGDSYSRLDWHTALAGTCTAVGTGMLRIVHGAKGSDAAQLFRNLLLSDGAKANSIPELEVSECDVVGCGHGTANGPIDEQQAFYLESRGFSESEARAILTAAFLNATLLEMGGDGMHAWLLGLVEGRLASLRQ